MNWAQKSHFVVMDFATIKMMKKPNADASKVENVIGTKTQNEKWTKYPIWISQSYNNLLCVFSSTIVIKFTHVVSKQHAFVTILQGPYLWGVTHFPFKRKPTSRACVPGIY